MEQTPLPPLLSDEILSHLNCRCENCVRRVAKVIEADRAKTREVVQALVDAIVDNAKYRLLTEGEEGDTLSDFMNLTLGAALALAKSQLNIAPTKP